MGDVDQCDKGHIHGNFRNYYQFHSADSRTIYLTESVILKIWENTNKPEIVTILDVGCNEGDLSIAIHNKISNILEPKGVKVFVLGIDLDEELVQRAQKKTDEKLKDKVSFLACDIMSSIEILNVFMSERNIEKFTIVSAFSITMWIHLNSGDIGLNNFLCHLSNVAFCLIIEPQNWKSYKNALKRTRKLGLPKPLHYESIKIREDIDKHINKILVEECGFLDSSKVPLGVDSWGRKLLLYLRELAFFDEKRTHKKFKFTTNLVDAVEGDYCC